MAARANKRRYLRTRAANLIAHLRIGDRTIQAPIEDISMGGMLARTGESIAIGTALMFDLARPGLKKPLRLLGVIVDARGGRGLGVRFDGMDKETAERLGDMIADLGAMTSPSSLLVDTEADAELPQMPRAALPAPVPSPRPPGRSANSVGTSAPAVASISDNEMKLHAQMRSMVMELGRLHEVVQQREKELTDSRGEVVRLKSEALHGEAAQRIVGRLEIEKNKLESQLADAKARARIDLDVAQREGEQATAAIARLLDVLQRLR